MNVKIEEDEVYLNGSKIGRIEGNIEYNSGLSFHTNRNEQGVLHKFDSFGLSEDVVEALLEAGIDQIVIHFSNADEKARYYADLNDFLDGKVFHNPQNDGDKQLHLPRSEMSKLKVCDKY